MILVACFISRSCTRLIVRRRARLGRVQGLLAYSEMAAVSETDYEKAVSALNGLQSNFQVLSEMRKQSKRRSKDIFQKTPEFLSRVGIEVHELDSLNVIHVAGTKGKGSVCALCESILRSHGLKTGFYSSPHLLEVRERIRINGVPLGKELFVNYFWQCYDSLTRNKELYEEEMPAYFRFLTLLAFKVFLMEKVDVAIIEVGIGGSYDSTNVIQRPKVCGITSLGYDHVDVLGTTIQEITWHKTGICKRGVPLFTSLQSDEALQVIRSRSKELSVSSVAIAPSSSSYPNHEEWNVGIAGAHQLENTSLAVQLCRQWLKDMGKWEEEKELEEDTTHSCGINIANPFSLPSNFMKGLSECVWPGRCQVIKRVGVSYYLDGAHTVESLRVCSNWFKESAHQEQAEIQGPLVKVLIFNFSGRREAHKLMDQIYFLGFDYVLFCPNVANKVSHSSDQTNYNVSSDDMLTRCYDNEKAWLYLPGVTKRTKVFECISESVEWIGTVRDVNKELYVQVLICGSLHLVGGAMNVLGVTVMGDN